jgi:GMP synthase (glutamine-hydrolysing)
MTKPFLIIQLRPENVTADSELAAILRYGQLQAADMVRLRAEQNGLPGIELDRFCGIIVGGSPFDISTPERDKSSLQRQIEAGFMRLLEQVTSRDFPFLGCCSGNGLLAKFCGSAISRRYAEAVGGIDITLTAAARLDPLLHDLPASIRVMVGHKEACDETPVEATLLASSQSCPVQMFRLQQNIYATQFHPEGDAQEFITRIKTYRHNGYFDPDHADALIRRVSRERTPWSHEILRRFVHRYALASAE